jgi:colanic acid biosynthesis glycosyl transferase WcaI
MKILVLGINYSPEKTSVAPFTTGLCEHLVQQGHRVTVVTACPYYPGWRVFDEYRGARFRRETINGVAVQRVWHFVPWRPSGLWQRLAHDLSFTITAFVAGLLAGKCDVIYCSCPPPTLGLAAFALSKIRRAPFVIKLTDLATDTALATGIMHDGVAIRIAQQIESFVYRKAKSIACLCQGFIEHLAQRGVDLDKVRLIPDWGDTEKIRPLRDSTRFRIEHNIPAQGFLVMHTGNMGKKQCLINALKAAELTRDEQRICWLLVGDGEERELLQREVTARALHQVRLLPLQPVEMLPHMFAEADLLLLNQLSAIEDAVIPSKLLTYMAAGRPIVAAVSERSESAQHVLRACCGLVIQPESPEALAEAVLRLAREPEHRQQFGANGRAYAEAHFRKSAVLKQYDLLFDEIAANGLSSLLSQRAAPSH